MERSTSATSSIVVRLATPRTRKVWSSSSRYTAASPSSRPRSSNGWIETAPIPLLLPMDAADRARPRALAALVRCDIYFSNHGRVLERLRQLQASDRARRNMCVGGTATLADLYVDAQARACAASAVTYRSGLASRPSTVPARRSTGFTELRRRCSRTPSKSRLLRPSGPSTRPRSEGEKSILRGIHADAHLCDVPCECRGIRTPVATRTPHPWPELHNWRRSTPTLRGSTCDATYLVSQARVDE